MLTTPPVILHIEGPLATIRLNRPHALNALDLDGLAALGQAVAQLHDRPDLRAVLIRGEGKAFMAGADLAAVAGDLEDAPKTITAMIDALHPAITALTQLPLPVVAAVHGAVAGAGFSLMLACDFAIADENTCFSLAYSRIGGSLDGGCSWMLPRIVGRRKALEIAMLAEPFNAEAALELGLINELAAEADFDSTVRKWGDRLANGPTRSYGRIKSLLAASSSNKLEAQLDAEREAFALCAGTGDFREGVTAFLEKRKPQFLGQ